MTQILFQKLLVGGGFVVVAHCDLVGPSEVVEDQDARDVQLGNVPAVIWNSRYENTVVHDRFLMSKSVQMANL